MKIAIEGMDGVGKTTIAKKFKSDKIKCQQIVDIIIKNYYNI